MKRKSFDPYRAEAVKSFYFIALTAFMVSLLLNQPDYFQHKRWSLVLIDGSTVLVIITSLILFMIKRVSLRINAAIFIYGSAINLALSIWIYYYHNLFFSGNFLLNTIIFSIYLVLAGFCIGRKHIFIVAAIYLSSYIPLIIISADEFLTRILLVLPFLIIMYSFAISSLIFLINRSYFRESEYNAALIQKEKELTEEHNRGLKVQLDIKNCEILAKSMFLSGQSENHNDFITKLNILKIKLNSSEQHILENIIVKHQEENLNRHWKDFETSFLEVNPEFYRKLQNACPTLSNSQRKLAALIYLGLSSKQIGSILNNSTESVEVARSRLRAKFNIPVETNLHGFLRSL